MYDMFVGGVSSPSETPKDTALREIGEELNMRDLGRVSEGLFEVGVCTTYNRCLVTCFRYDITDDDDVKWQEEEVEWGGFMEREEVERRAREDGDWVPDGLQVWKAWLEWEKSSTSAGESDPTTFSI